MRVRLALSKHQLAAVELMLATQPQHGSLDALVAHAVAAELRAPWPWRGRRPAGRRPSRAGADELDLVVAPGSGCALALARGDRLRIEQTAGGQCADLRVFAGERPALQFSAARTRALHGVHPTRGDVLWSGAPETPLLDITADSAPGHDLCFPACTPFEYAHLTGRRDHPSCEQIQSATLSRAGLAPASGQDPLNLWLRSAVEPDGRLRAWPATCRRGDHVDLVARLDLVAVVNPCPDDLYGSSQYEPHGIRVLVARNGAEPDRGPVLLAVSSPLDLGDQAPRTVRLPDRLAAAVDRVRASGWLGGRRGEVVRALLLRWWERERAAQAASSGGGDPPAGISQTDS